MPLDPTALPSPDFTPTATIARTLKAYLVATLVQAQGQTDRNGLGVFAAPAPVVSNVFRFDGDPTAAIQAGLDQRTEATRDLPFVVCGYERTAQSRTALDASPKVQRLPFSVLVLFPQRIAGDPDGDGIAATRAEQIEADAEALDYAADLVSYFVRPRFVSPFDWGLLAIEAGDQDPGFLSGLAATVSFRRIPFTFVRGVQN